MRLLVTGGAGFIGSNFIRFWLRRRPRDTVVNFDLLTYAGDLRSLSDVVSSFGARYQHIRGDIADGKVVDDLFASIRPELVVNFAAESHNSRAVLDSGAFIRTNVLGTHMLLEACRRFKVPRFHHVSTCEVYGDLPLDSTDAFTEESPYRPRTPYNASKAAADLIARAYQETFGLGITISVCSNNYGPFQHPEKVIPLFTTHALRDSPLPLYRSSAHVREWLHVEDHCRALEAIIERGKLGQTYNIGSGVEVSIEELADLVLDILGKPRGLKQFVPDRPGHDRRYLLDHSKVEHELAWQPVVPFDEGLRTTIAWYVENRQWWEPKLTTTIDESGWSEALVQRRDPN